MRIFIIISSLLFVFNGFAADAPYAVSKIPAHLLKNANVVKRMEETKFEIQSNRETVLSYKYALTVLNENGDDNAVLIEWYDKLRKIQSIEGVLYDANGNQLKKIRTKDVQDVSAVDDISLIDDNRKKLHSFYHKVYPYTVEYVVEVKYNNTFYFPYWIPQDYQHMSVEKSSFTLICPADYDLRYKMFHYNGQPKIDNEKNKKIYNWSIGEMPAIKREYFSPKWHEMTTTVSLAPSQFEIEGYKGNMSNWQEFGKFLYALKKDRDELPDGIKEKVKQIIGGLKTDKEKAVALYKFLQQNTRYISIQLGLGGWQPFDAAYVANKGYGDCKALSNYMYSLLKFAGIRSLYALIKAGDGDYYLMEEFSSNQFNHAILCVPMAKDTLWLECTDQTKPAGYMGNFTGNRKALLVDENGGVLVQTPKYGLQENIQARTIKASVSTDGIMELKSNTLYSAIQQDNLFQKINSLSKEKLKESLNEDLGLSTYNINDFAYKIKSEDLPQINEDLDISVSNYATFSGKRLFITPNILNRQGFKLSDEERKYDIDMVLEYKDIDSVEIDVPAGYEPELIPKNFSYKNKFGKYDAKFSFIDNKIKYIRTIEQFSGRFPASDYKELVKYFEDVYKADRARIVLVKKE